VAGQSSGQRGGRGRAIWLLIGVAVLAMMAAGIWLRASATDLWLRRALHVQGSIIRSLGKAGDLEIPIPLCPGSRIDGYTLEPTGFGNQMGIYVRLSTSDRPQKVVDYYLRVWERYGIHSLPLSHNDPAMNESWFVTRRPRVLTLGVAETAAGRPKSLRDSLPPPTPTSRETKVMFFVTLLQKVP